MSGRNLTLAAILACAVFAASEARAEWLTTTSVANAKADDAKWTDVLKASDGDPARYTVDQSNRVGDGAGLKLSFGDGVCADQVRFNADNWIGAVDYVVLKVNYGGAAPRSETFKFTAANYPNAAYKYVPITAGTVTSLEFNFHYTVTGYWFWLYEVQLFRQVPPVLPPVGKTLDPTSVNATSAVLHGAVESDGGGACKMRFKYGLTTAYGMETPWQEYLGKGNAISAYVPALTAGQQYHYCAEIQNVAGTMKGEDKSFVACPEESEDGAVWVSPTSYVDATWETGSLASKHWETPDAAYDDCDTTTARFYHVIHDGPEWSPPLQLKVPKGLYNGIRFKAAKPDAFIDKIRVEIHHEGSTFTTVYEGPFRHNIFEEATFPCEPLEMAQVSFHMSSAGVGAYWTLYEFDFRKMGVNLVSPGVPYYLEEEPGVDIAKDGDASPLNFKFGQGTESLLAGTVKVTKGEKLQLFTDPDCANELTTLSYNLAVPAERAAFSSTLLNRTLYVRGMKADPANISDEVKCELVYGETASDQVKYNVLALEFVTSGEGDSTEPTKYAAVSDPNPSMSLDPVAKDGIVILNGQATVTVSGTINDPASDNAPEPGQGQVQVAAEVLINGGNNLGWYAGALEVRPREFCAAIIKAGAQPGDPATVVNLGTLGGPTSVACAVGAAAAVVGASTDASGRQRAFLFIDANTNGTADPGEMVDLGTLGGMNSVAYSINAGGQVVGTAETIAGESHAFLFKDRNGNGRADPGEMIDLGTLGGKNSVAHAIGADGQVVGAAETAAGESHAFLFKDANGNGQADPGEMVDLGGLGGKRSAAYATNANGQVVGMAETAAGERHAFLFKDANGSGQADPGEMVDMGALGGKNSAAYAIGAGGQVVGAAETAAGESHAFLFKDANGNRLVDPGEMIDLGTLGGNFSEARSVTDAGIVAGTSTSATGAQQAFIYDTEIKVLMAGAQLTLPAGVPGVAVQTGDISISVPVQRVEGVPGSAWRQHPYVGKFGPVAVAIPAEGEQIVSVRTRRNLLGAASCVELKVSFKDGAVDSVVQTSAGNLGTYPVALRLACKTTDIDRCAVYLGGDKLEMELKPDGYYYAKGPSKAVGACYEYVDKNGAKQKHFVGYFKVGNTYQVKSYLGDNEAALKAALKLVDKDCVKPELHMIPVPDAAAVDQRYDRGNRPFTLAPFDVNPTKASDGDMAGVVISGPFLENGANPQKVILLDYTTFPKNKDQRLEIAKAIWTAGTVVAVSGHGWDTPGGQQDGTLGPPYEIDGVTAQHFVDAYKQLTAAKVPVAKQIIFKQCRAGGFARAIADGTDAVIWATRAVNTWDYTNVVVDMANGTVKNADMRTDRRDITSPTCREDARRPFTALIAKYCDDKSAMTMAQFTAAWAAEVATQSKKYNGWGDPKFKAAALNLVLDLNNSAECQLLLPYVKKPQP